MDALITIQGIPADALLEQFRAIVREEFRKCTESVQDPETLISPKETCSLFTPAITTATLSNWSADGKINKYRIGGRVFYKRSEVLSAAHSLKKHRRTL